MRVLETKELQIDKKYQNLRLKDAIIDVINPYIFTQNKGYLVGGLDNIKIKFVENNQQVEVPYSFKDLIIGTRKFEFKEDNNRENLEKIIRKW